MQCLDDTGLARFVEGKLSADDTTATEHHLASCDSCRALFGQLMASGPAGRGSAPAVAEGAMIDRYVIERELGFGAMGRVYLAIDPELDRKVAIKVLRAAAADADRDLRLRREAQALAKVTHPNVATVYDVGEVAGTLFLAMEVGDREQGMHSHGLIAQPPQRRRIEPGIRKHDQADHQSVAQPRAGDRIDLTDGRGDRDPQRAVGARRPDPRAQSPRLDDIEVGVEPGADVAHVRDLRRPRRPLQSPPRRRVTMYTR